ncbi:dna ligase 4 [Quercus suber]|uniref:Dna ligase 4 n=1 Tax=Quercus suber TaxID=58331 RepID=A0AAW0LCU4_QUESU
MDESATSFVKGTSCLVSNIGDAGLKIHATEQREIEFFRDEGIVLKDLGSKWEPSDRTGKWLKLKPEYIRAAQFLVGIAELPAPNTYPRRVGTGLSDDELDAVVTKLKPYFRKYEYPQQQPPSFYQVTNNSKERPDVWIDSPEKSIILSITSDIRTIRSEVFAAPYSLRFPRIDRVRYEKPWHECLDVQSFVELVHSSNGTTQRGMDYGGLQESKPKRMKTSKKGNVSIVPSHLNFVNVPPTHSLDSFHKMVAENGGTFSMNLNNSVTHCVAADSKGIKYQAAKRHGDIINYSWILDCCSQKKPLHLQPKHFLFLSNSSKKLQEEIDEFSDSYYQDLDLADIKQLLSNVNRYEDTKTVDCYKKKYCPKEKWSRFHGCCVYLHPPVPSLKPDWEVLMGLALKRLKLVVSIAGGKVSDSLVLATHLVVLSVPGFEVDFETVLNSFTSSEKHLLMNKRLHVVKYQWLEDCMERDERLQEETYSLKTIEVEDSSTVEW